MASATAPRKGGPQNWVPHSYDTRVDYYEARESVLDAAPTIACGERALRLLRLQRPGRAVLDGASFLRGFALPPGTVLPSPEA